MANAAHRAGASCVPGIGLAGEFDRVFAPVTRAHLLHVVGARRPLGGQLSGMSYSPDRAATFDG